MKIKTKMHLNKKYFPLFLAEGIVLLFMLFYIFTPLTSYTFKNTTDLPALTLPSGSYRITLQQEVTAPEGVPDHSNSGATVGICEFTSAQKPSAFYPLTIEQKDGHETVTAILTVKPFQKITDMQVSFQQTAEGTISVSSLSIAQSRSYRVVQLLGVLLLFLLADLIVCIQTDVQNAEQNTRLSGHDACRSFRLTRLLNNPRWFVIGSAAALLLACIPLYSSALFYGDDVLFHMTRIQGIADALYAGQFPVRMHSSLLNGYGYPASVFYGDILLYLPALLYLCAVPLQNAYKIYVILINTGTFLISYYSFGKIFSKKSYGFIGALVYLFFPYRFANVYTRAAAGEYSAMMFLPLIFLGFYNLFYRDNEKTDRDTAPSACKETHSGHHSIPLRDYLPLILGLTGLIQTHMLSCEIVAVFIVLFCIVKIKITLKPTVFFALVKSCVITFLLNIWFFVPFFDFMQGEYNLVAEEYHTIQKHGISVTDIISLFQFENLKTLQFDAIRASFLAAFLLFLLLVFTIFATRTYKNIRFIHIGAALALWMSTSYFPWDVIIRISGPFQTYVQAQQFPWRYLSIATPFLTLCLLYTLKQLSEAKRIRLQKVFLLCCAALICCNAALLNLKIYGAGTPMYITGKSDLDIYGSLLVGRGEYVPAGTSLSIITDREPHFSDSIEVNNYLCENGLTTLSLKNASSDDAYLELPYIYYRHYSATDHAHTPFSVSCSNENKLRITIPAHYSGTISVSFQPPWYYRMAELISLLTFAAILLSLSRDKKGVTGSIFSVFSKKQ